ncbi:MAG: HAMP domain-containing histidine kinase [Sporocytophaga sp.]|uniref:sensor histidine kinase n=1 Tax=Sporocytophaga sp. TaxID=2231183 RepID=UPI001B077E3B|nr:HAMP domain-containing sensor histidine kinase [Sporocytophaga sp.]MBO9703863.1 HAMP domain-containing histidine kinase [Sporocytophaga sp.]
MKLLTKTTIYYILISLITYLLIAGTFYIAVKHLIYKEVEERLRAEQHDFEAFVKRHGGWDESSYFVENKIEITKLRNFDPVQAEDSFKDTIFYDKFARENVPFRELTFYNSFKNDWYKISIRKSLIETTELIRYITLTMLFLLNIGLSSMFIFFRKMSKNIWMPFYNTLDKAKKFDIKDDKDVQVSETKIYEFNELNDVIKKMTGKMRKDYLSLKEYTENASHEIQTPLAIINSKVENLIQCDNLTDNQVLWIEEIQNACLKISKMHKALLLLSKIDNGQYNASEQIDFNDMIRGKLEEFEALYTHKNISISFINKGTFLSNIHADLADILLTNIIKNSIVHNVSHGAVNIEIKNTSIEVCNTGQPLITVPEKLFERFKKDKASDSLGLGLSIVKKIADHSGLKVEYRYGNSLHKMILSK